MPASNTTQEIQSGQTAIFGESRFVCGPSASEPVEASLKLQANPAGKAMLSASLAASETGMRLEFRAVDISLTRLLESATGVEVQGGENVAAAGKNSHGHRVCTGQPDAGIHQLPREVQLREISERCDII